MPRFDSTFGKTLGERVRGDVSVDPVTMGIYSTDASNYQMTPVAVVLPRDDADVLAAIETAGEFGVSILPRGGGTSLAGQTVGASMILDFSKYMNQVLELNVEEGWARVQPGLVRDEFNAVVAPYGLQFAPDPATADRANIGGMIGNNSSGTKSILFGKTIDHVLATRVLLTDGTELSFSGLTSEEYADRASRGDREGEILTGFRAIVDAHREEIARRFPKVMRRVGGYNLDEFIGTDRWNLSRLMVGSEGTLATLLEARINLEPLPKATLTCVVHFESLSEAMRSVGPIVAFAPAAVEVLDNTVLRMARENLTIAPLCDFFEGRPESVLIVEFYGDTTEELAARAIEMGHDLKAKGLGYAYPIQRSQDAQQRVWTVRKNGLGLMLGIKGHRKPIPFIEDACVPLPVLPEYIDQVLAICKDLDVEVALYAHASVGVIHVRPILDLRLQEDIDRMKEIADRTFELVVRYEGSWSGEHGDGLVRSPYMRRFFGDEIYEAFVQVKALFDPSGLMNPGKILETPPMDQGLRYGTSYRTGELDTTYQYRKDGDFAAAVEMCTGVGACRKILGGTMCPSYMATRDEEHSTRGRANALRLAMTGQLGDDDLASARVQETLDLCLGCKACKAECPSNVDLAKLKGEVMQIARDRNGTTLRDRLIGKSMDAARFFSGGLAPLMNRVQDSGPFRGVLQRMVGFDRRRSLPEYSSERLRQWFERRDPFESKKKVILFADCYLNYFEPNIGSSAVELLESCGYEVILGDSGCCQRPRISQGLLREAREEGAKTLKRLDAIGDGELEIVVCEPSCASALTDDQPDLAVDSDLADRVSSRVRMIDGFLDAVAGETDFRLTSEHKGVLIHGHCHQKALYGTSSMKSLLARVPGLEVTEVDSGCCGMAGSFGYEREHYDLSRTIGDRILFPAVREIDSDTRLLACGFSCRHQIEHFTGVKAAHFVELLRRDGSG